MPIFIVTTHKATRFIIDAADALVAKVAGERAAMQEGYSSAAVAYLDKKLIGSEIQEVTITKVEP